MSETIYLVMMSGDNFIEAFDSLDDAKQFINELGDSNDYEVWEQAPTSMKKVWQQRKQQ